MAVFLSAFFDEFNKLSSSDHIDTCGNRCGLSYHRFLVKLYDPAVLIHLHTAKSGSIFSAYICAYYCDICSLCNVIFQSPYYNPVYIHSLLKVNDHIWFMAAFQET